MSDPLATPTMLGVYLGGIDIAADDARAIMILQMAHDLCETIVSPVPSKALGVELETAARCWLNVGSVHTLGIGTATASFGASFGTQSGRTAIGGLYLSKTQKATLRRMSGRSTAGSIDWLPAPVPTTVEPVISGMDPDVAGEGDLVRLDGYGLTDAVGITMGGVAVVTYEIVSDTVIHLYLPAGTAGEVEVIVTTENGSSVPYLYERA